MVDGAAGTSRIEGRAAPAPDPPRTAKPSAIPAITAPTPTSATVRILCTKYCGSRVAAAAIESYIGRGVNLPVEARAGCQEGGGYEESSVSIGAGCGTRCWRDCGRRPGSAEREQQCSGWKQDPRPQARRRAWAGASQGQGGAGLLGRDVHAARAHRRQAEEAIQLNPLDESNIIAGQNDSRIGFNHCGYDWSFDGGKKWGDQVPPFWQFTLLDNHTADACSDPTVAWDSRGNAYSGGVLFDVASGVSAIVVMKSNAGNGGAFYHSPNPAGGFQ